MNHGFLAKRMRRCTRLGAATTREGGFYLIGLASLSFPYLTRAAPPPDVAARHAAELQPARIVGEVFEVDGDDEAGLACLRELEFGYREAEVEVELSEHGASSGAAASPATTTATVYLLEDAATLAEVWEGMGKRYIGVPGGDWTAVGR